jgi:hypothetical protein
MALYRLHLEFNPSTKELKVLFLNYKYEEYEKHKTGYLACA